MNSKKRPSVLLVTGFPFWALGDGQCMRLLALVWTLGQHVHLTILYLGRAGGSDVQRLRSLRVSAEFHALGASGDQNAHVDAVRTLCATRPFDYCILERLALDHVRTGLPVGVKTVLDSHDLLSDRTRSRATQGLPVDRSTFEWELEAFGRYDCVLMIQAEEHARVAPLLTNVVILAPHPVVFARRPLRLEGRTLGFVGAFNEPNVDALEWFSHEVWPRMGKSGEVHVFGRIGDMWRPGDYPEFVRHGFLPDFNQVWGSIDVAINPVRWGSGLKIKSVEAIGNGLPLVTTREGARGLTHLDGEALLIADGPAAFADACRRCLADPDLRERLGTAGYEYARRNLSPKACFGGFIAWLNG